MHAVCTSFTKCKCCNLWEFGRVDEDLVTACVVGGGTVHLEYRPGRVYPVNFGVQLLQLRGEQRGGGPGVSQLVHRSPDLFADNNHRFQLIFIYIHFRQEVVRKVANSPEVENPENPGVSWNNFRPGQ